MRLLSMLVLCYIHSACYAISFLAFDPAAMATGGAGSVTGIDGAQPFLSPVTFAAEQPLFVLRAHAGVRVIDRQHFLETAESVKNSDAEQLWDQRLANVRRAIKTGESDSKALRELGDTADRLTAELNKLPDKPLRLSGSAGVYAIGRNQGLAAGAFSRDYLVLGARIENDPADLARIKQLQAGTYAIADVLDSAARVEDLARAVDWPHVEDLIRASLHARATHPELRTYRDIEGVRPLLEALDQLRDDVAALDKHVDLETLARVLLADEQALLARQSLDLGIDPRGYLRYPIPTHINSHIVYSGAEIRESGVNFSFAPAVLPELTLGVNLKEVRFSTIAFKQRLDQFELEHYRHPDTRVDYRFLDLDVGAHYHLSPAWTLGGVVKNLHRKVLADALGNEIRLAPIARVGIAYETPALLVALDADLTRNEPLGFDPDKQYAALGAEWRYWRRNSLRLGYRYNYIDRSGLPAAGLGFQVGPASLALGATYSEAHEEAGLSLQTGLQF